MEGSFGSVWEGTYRRGPQGIATKRADAAASGLLPDDGNQNQHRAPGVVERVALKQIRGFVSNSSGKVTPDTSVRLLAVQNEIKIAARVRHPNLAGLKGFCDDPESVTADGKHLGVALMFELATEGTLDDLIKSLPPLQTKETVGGDGSTVEANAVADGDGAKQWRSLIMLPVFQKRFCLPLSDVAEGMKQLHYGSGVRSILHRDLKPSNVLLTYSHRGHVVDTADNTDDSTQLYQVAPERLTARVADFGLSATLSTEDQTSTSKAGGTIRYTAPESLMEPPTFSTASDVYSFGALAFHVATRTVPYAHIVRDVNVVSAVTIQHELLDLAPLERVGVPMGLRELVSGCLSHNESERPTFLALVPRVRALADTLGVLDSLYEYEPDMKRALLGKGAFGNVYRVKNPIDGQIYAAKQISMMPNTIGSFNAEASEVIPAEESLSAERAKREEELQMAVSEVRKMRDITSDFVVKYHDAHVWREESLYIIMELLVDAVPWRDVITTRSDVKAEGIGDPVALSTALRWVKEVALGLSHLHNDCGIIHHDLHNCNVVLVAGANTHHTPGACDDDALSHRRVKIVDLGLASVKESAKKNRSTAAAAGVGGSPRHELQHASVGDIHGFKAIRAPEICAIVGDDTGCETLSSPSVGQLHKRTSVRYDSKVDCWALGLLAAELALNRNIEMWYEERDTLLSFGYTRPLQSEKISEAETQSAALGSLVRRLLEWDSTERLSADGVVAAIEELRRQGLSEGCQQPASDMPGHLDPAYSLHTLNRVHTAPSDAR